MQKLTAKDFSHLSTSSLSLDRMMEIAADIANAHAIGLEAALHSVAAALGITEADIDSCKTAEELAGKCATAIARLNYSTINDARNIRLREENQTVREERDQLRSALRETAMALKDTISVVYRTSYPRIYKDAEAALNNPVVKAVMEEKQ